MIFEAISRVILGAVFLFSGFTKCIDPQGFAYSITEYLFAFKMGSLTGFSIAIAATIIFLEIATGIALILKYKTKVCYFTAFLFMFLFTGLTLALAVTNKIEDCGCFGSTLVLSNWQSFTKNIVLLIPATYLFMLSKQNRHRKTRSEVRQGVLFTILLTLAAALTTHCYINQPLFDLPNYAVGSKIEPIIHREAVGVNLIQIIPNVTKVKESEQDEFNKIFMFCKEQNINFNAYTSSGDEQRVEYMRKCRIPYEIEIADEMSLKNLMRSNVGLIAVSDGTIIGKWSINNMPSISEFQNKGVVTVSMEQHNSTKIIMAIIIAITLIIACIGINRKVKY